MKASLTSFSRDWEKRWRERYPGKSNLERWDRSTKVKFSKCEEAREVCGPGVWWGRKRWDFKESSLGRVIIRTVFTLGIKRLSNGFQQRSD